MDEGPRVRRDRTGDAGFVSLLRAGDTSAFGILVDAWADIVYDRLSHRGFTTADALDLSTATFAEVYRQLVDGTSNDPFGVQVLRIARQQAVAADRLRVDLFLAVGPFAGDRLTHGTDAGVLASEEPVATFLLETAALLGESASEVLDLHERHDFDAPAIAALLGIPIDAVTDLAVNTPDAFRELIGVQLVWRQGAPACTELATALARHTKLEAGTRRAVVEHLRGCTRCRAAATPALDPVMVLAAIPISVTPAGFKPALVETLSQIGLPVSGSVAYRLPPAARGMAAAPPPPPPPLVPSFVAAPPPPTLTPRPAVAPPASSPEADREPELAALMISDRFTPARTLAAVPPLVEEPPPVEDDELADELADENRWAAEEIVADGAGQLAPPPPLDAPTPVVPAFEASTLSTVARTAPDLGGRRKRWFRIVDA